MTMARPDTAPHTARTHTRLTDTPLSLDAAHAFVADPAAGASVTFTGMVRDHAVPDEEPDGAPRDVAGLDYEAYDEVATARLADLAGEVAEKWPDVLAIWAEHRTGRLAIGDLAVVVAVSSPHRHTAFEAGRHLIDTLKATVPIWKKEHWADGGAHWPGTD